MSCSPQHSNIVSTASTTSTIDSTKQGERKRTPIWQYFKRINESIMKCTIWDKGLKITKTSRFGLQRHLLIVHNITKNELLNVKLKTSKQFDVLKRPFCIHQLESNSIPQHFKRFLLIFRFFTYFSKVFT